MVLIEEGYYRGLKFEMSAFTKSCFIYSLLDSSNSSSFTFYLVRSLLALEATEPVSELVTQTALELINNHLISVQQKR